MKKILLIPVVVFCLNASGQSKIISIESVDDIIAAVGDKQYVFKDFTEGTVALKSGETGSGLLNYNTMLNELQFISDEQILSVKNQRKVDSAIIDNRVFVNVGNGFAEIIAQNGDKKLSVRKEIKVKSAPKQSGYGGRSETAAIESYSALYSAQRYMQLPAEVQITESTVYLLFDKNKTVTADKSGFLKSFPKNKKNINEFVKLNRISFNDENQLKQLFDYCTSL